MTDDLNAFVRARLDDEERMARAVEGIRQPWYFELIDDAARPLVELALDPARVLAEVDAKRRILDEHPVIPEPYGSAGHCERCIDPEAGGPDPAAVYPCTTVRLLALPLAGHPGYRDEWKP